MSLSLFLHTNSPVHTIQTSQLAIAYYAFGDSSGWPCIQCHGFPYDVHCFAETVAPLVDQGAYVLVPYLRGYGPTHFLSDSTLRSGEQAVLANDLLEFMDALSVPQAVLTGFDWGGRAACIVAALWPERVSALVSGNSYNVQDIPNAMDPAPAAVEANFWYQYYFHCERGRRGLETNRQELCRFLWKTWSPLWDFSEEEFQRTAVSFDNPDFVDVVVHSYRHRFGLVDGDPTVADIETQLEQQPNITVPSITIDGDVDGVVGDTSAHAHKFTASHEHRIFKNAGHNLPQERPEEWIQAVLDARRASQML